jgi:hypothetical protein
MEDNLNDSDQKNDQESEDVEFSLIEENETSTTTNVVLDLKTGIYNLFVSLFHNLAIEYGPEHAIRISTEFLNEIVSNFRSALPENNEDTV